MSRSGEVILFLFPLISGFCTCNHDSFSSVSTHEMKSYLDLSVAQVFGICFSHGGAGIPHENGLLKPHIDRSILTQAPGSEPVTFHTPRKAEGSNHGTRDSRSGDHNSAMYCYDESCTYGTRKIDYCTVYGTDESLHRKVNTTASPG